MTPVVTAVAQAERQVSWDELRLPEHGHRASARHLEGVHLVHEQARRRVRARDQVRLADARAGRAGGDVGRRPLAEEATDHAGRCEIETGPAGGIRRVTAGDRAARRKYHLGRVAGRAATPTTAAATRLTQLPSRSRPGAATDRARRRNRPVPPARRPPQAPTTAKLRARRVRTQLMFSFLLLAVAGGDDVRLHCFFGRVRRDSR